MKWTAYACCDALEVRFVLDLCSCHAHAVCISFDLCAPLALAVSIELAFAFTRGALSFENEDPVSALSHPFRESLWLSHAEGDSVAFS